MDGPIVPLAAQGLESSRITAFLGLQHLGTQFPQFDPIGAGLFLRILANAERPDEFLYEDLHSRELFFVQVQFLDHGFLQLANASNETACRRPAGGERYERQAAQSDFILPFSDFAAFHEQFSLARRLVLRVTSLGIRRYVALPQKDFPIADDSKGLVQRGLSGT